MNPLARLWHGYYPFAVTFIAIVALPLAVLGGAGAVMAISLTSEHPSPALLPASQAPTAWPGSGEVHTAAPNSTQAARDQAAQDQAARDAAAAAPMPLVNAVARRPTPPSSQDFGVLHLPLAATSAPDAAFPRTPQGAVQALASLDAAGIAAQTPAAAEPLWQRTATAGAMPFTDWVVPRTLAAGAAQLASRLRASSDPTAAAVLAGSTTASPGPRQSPPPGWTTSFTPTHGLIKAVLDDGDFVVACVLGRWSASAAGAALNRTTLQLGMADCQRMQWTPRGWRIGAGAAPFPPPVTWPGSALCLQVGWKELRDA